MKKLLILVLLLLVSNVENVFAKYNLNREISHAFNSIADLSEYAAQSVVSLEVSVQGQKKVKLLYRDKGRFGSEVFKIHPKLMSFEEKIGDGSGFIVSDDGYIVTNYHVISPKVRGRELAPSKIEVILFDGQRYVAELIGKDPDSDIAVIKINAKGLRPISWADSDLVRPGQFALTIGSSLGAEHTVGFGIISAVSRKKPSVSKEALLGGLDYIQTYAQINPGNSGGPLIDLEGHVIGITSFIQLAPHSPGFAIPSNYAKRVATALMQDGYVTRPSIGVLISSPAGKAQDVFSLFAKESDYEGEEKETIGVLVNKVIPGSPADKAGIRPDDIITKMNGEIITSPVEFIRTIRTSPIGSRFALEIQRYDQTRTINLKSVSTRP